MIGNDVEVTVLDIKGGQVRLGINAPKTISVHRGEIHEKVINDNSVSYTHLTLPTNREV